MLTTTVNGLWVLQVLSGIETLAAELGLRPYLPSAETAQTALAHPDAHALRQCGAINPGDAVDAPVREWLTVLARREAAVLLRVQRPNAACDRILIARYAQWWVVLERTGDIVRLHCAGTAATQAAADALISAQIDRVCGPTPIAAIRSLTIDVGDLLAAVAAGHPLARYLADRGVEADGVAALTAAADPDRSTHVNVVAIQAGCRVEPDVLTIIDAPPGRLLCEHLRRAGRRWMVVGPATAAAVGAAVRTMLDRLPAQTQGHLARKAA